MLSHQYGLGAVYRQAGGAAAKFIYLYTTVHAFWPSPRPHIPVISYPIHGRPGGQQNPIPEREMLARGRLGSSRVSSNPTDSGGATYKLVEGSKFKSNPVPPVAKKLAAGRRGGGGQQITSYLIPQHLLHGLDKHVLSRGGGRKGVSSLTFTKYICLLLFWQRGAVCSQVVNKSGCFVQDYLQL